MKISPAIKGLITALVMIASTLLIDQYKDQIDPRLQYLVYVIFAAGIIWTLISFKRSGSFTGKFAELFGQGFRCFIIVTLAMVSFTYVYIRLHPELAEEEAKNTIAYYQEKGDKTPPEIEEIGKKAKKQYPIAAVSLSIFRYLIMGAFLTAASSLLLIRRL